MPGNRRLLFLTVCALLVGAGLLTRWPGLGRHIALKYAGSVLWGSMIYGVSATLWPRAKSQMLAIGAAIFSALIEFSQLWHLSFLDAIRGTTVGVLLIGKYFSWWDIAAYFAGIALLAGIDSVLFRRSTR